MNIRSFVIEWKANIHECLVVTFYFYTPCVVDSVIRQKEKAK